MSKEHNAKGNLIKETNLKKLRQILREQRILTKSQLAELSGLSVVTIQSLMKTLLDNGEITEDATVQPQLGRPAASFRYNASHRLALIVNMYESDGQDTAEYTVYNLCGEVLDRHLETIPTVTLESFHNAIDGLISSYPAISVIGFGMPAEEMEGRLVISDYKFLQNTELAAYYETRCHLPVFVENDINAALLGYCVSQHYPAGQDFYNAAIYLPTKYPAGASLCHNYQILKGRNGLAGELKYLPLDIDWTAIPYTPKALEDIALKVMQVLISIYNPDRIILYSESLTPAIGERLKALYPTTTDQIFIPEVELYRSMKEDLDLGLIQSALEKLNS